MVLEVAVIHVRPGSAGEFEAAYRTGREIVLAAPGALAVRLVRGIESPSRFILLVEWHDIDAHEAFRESDAYPAWRAAVGSYFAGPPTTGHYSYV
jgi:heme-degrading monooxygenase HmoA